MAGSNSAYETDYRTVTIKTIDGSTVQGKVNIAPNHRVSDLLVQQNERFLVVIAANYQDFRGKTLFINKNHIVWVELEAIRELKRERQSGSGLVQRAASPARGCAKSQDSSDASASSVFMLLTLNTRCS